MDRTTSDPRKVLWVDDSYFDISSYAPAFYLNGFEPVIIDNPDQVLPTIEQLIAQLALVILDVRLPPGQIIDAQMTRGGFETGLLLGARIRGQFPQLPILGFSVCTDEKVQRWFTKYANGYLVKSPFLKDIDVFRCAEAIIRRQFGPRRLPRIFIVHGHAHNTVLELKNYLQNELRLGEPIVLHEQPNHGRTLIEKFEDETEQVDLVFVLLTPDDLGAAVSSLEDEKRRARQNVIFEMGYFYGRLRRRSGTVILCHSGDLELPSDISGVVYVNISGGVTVADRDIRRELREWLPQL